MNESPESPHLPSPDGDLPAGNQSSEEPGHARFRRLISSTDDTEPSFIKPDAPSVSPAQGAAASPPLPYLAPESINDSLRPTISPPPLVHPMPVTRSVEERIGSPLPHRVDEVDVDATRVSPVATNSLQPKPPSGLPSQPTRSVNAARVPPPSNRNPRTQPPPPAPVSSGTSWRKLLGCTTRLIIFGLFVFVIVGIVVVALMVREYASVAANLPPVDDLYSRASQFETTRILDRNGNILYEILDPNAGRRTYIPLSRISPNLLAATIATEDKNFYTHPGFDLFAIGRAFWQNWQNEGETVSGASTITQQLARLLLFSVEERYEQTYRRKVREALAAAEITRRYSKDEILELYLNEINYGSISYGIQAASETYFNTTADQLTLGQAAFLAGLPQSPSIYDIVNNRDATLRRMQDVLTLMYQTSLEDGCIYVSNSPTRVCVDSEAVLTGYTEIQNYPFQSPRIEMRYPHWVNYVRLLLESQYDAQTIYRSGFTIYTTIDPALQAEAEQLVKRQVEQLVSYQAYNGAMVAIQPATGEILAMVGSADFYNEEIDGQVNMAVSPTRQPGSSIKPFTYLAAFEKGWTPSTLLWDVQSEFPPSGDPNDPRPPYVPVNYDGRFHGPVTVRSALANSYNIPAVKTMQFVGVYDDPQTQAEDGLVAMMRRMGVNSLTRGDYGMALTLGGGEVSLLEMTGAFAVLANNGVRSPTVAITKIMDHQGNLVYEYQPQSQQVVRTEHAYLISSILSDNSARTPAFGAQSVLALPFMAAAKTGTTNDFRDNWTVGYTPDLAVGVWVGNADYSPMVNTTGLTGAAPIWADFMQFAVPKLTNGNPTPFTRPAGIIDRIVCSVSGAEPSEKCPSMRNEIFAYDQPPLPKEQDLWMHVALDTWTGLRASTACGDFVKDEDVINVTDPWAAAWLTQTDAGRRWAAENGFRDPLRFLPARECRTDDPRPLLSITSPGEAQTITSDTIDIFGQVDATAEFQNFMLFYGVGTDPSEYDWKPLMERSFPVSQVEKFYTWNLSETFTNSSENGFSALNPIPSGAVALRLYMKSTRNTYAELIVHLNFQIPTPTPTATPTPTETPTVTPTLEPTLTHTPTLTPLPTESPTLAPPPTETLTPTLVPSETPTPTL